MTTAQYLRIERMAGGCNANDRAFIRAARKLIAPVFRDNTARGARRDLYARITETRAEARAIYRRTTA